MAAPGLVRVFQDGQRVTFLIEGQGTMHLSPELRRHAESHLAAGATWLGVDLRACTYLDSTLIGTLLAIKRSAACQVLGSEFAIVSPSMECRQLLKQMRLESAFTFIDAASPPAATCCELPPESCDVSSFKRNIVQAHQELAQLGGPAGEPFRALAARMSQEFDAETTQSG